MARWIEQRAHGAKVVLRSREMSDMQAAVLSGAGLAVLPCLGADDEAGLVRLTSRVFATRNLSLVYPRKAKLSQPVQAVIRFVLSVIRENAERVAETAFNASGKEL